MRKIVALIAILLSFGNVEIKEAVCVEDNTLQTYDGNLWGVEDLLATGERYIVCFDTLGDTVIENDIIIYCISIGK